MTRRFYTDPLAASWMAKHFGMRFNPGVFGLVGRVLADDGNLSFEHGIGAELCTWDIHPDSLRLLKGIEGDVVRVMSNRGFGRIDSLIIWHDGKTDYRIDTIPGHYYQDEHITVIQRNGKAFIWPEQEAA